MKTAQYYIYLTKKGNIRCIARNADGIKKSISNPPSDAAEIIARRVHNSIKALKYGEKLIINCNLIEIENN